MDRRNHAKQWCSIQESIPSAGPQRWKEQLLYKSRQYPAPDDFFSSDFCHHRRRVSLKANYSSIPQKWTQHILKEMSNKHTWRESRSSLCDTKYSMKGFLQVDSLVIVAAAAIKPSTLKSIKQLMMCFLRDIYLFHFIFLASVNWPKHQYTLRFGIYIWFKVRQSFWGLGLILLWLHVK